MLEVERLSKRGRNDLISEAPVRMAVRPVIVEKDYWVCLTLELLFTPPQFEKKLELKR